MTNTVNTYGDPIPTVYANAMGYAWFVDADGDFMCAPAMENGTVDWDNIGEPCDMTEMTNEIMDNITHDLGLTSWPNMGTLPGEYSRS